MPFSSSYLCLLYVSNLTLSLSLVVSPILGDGIKELRNVHSNFLSDFQQVCNTYAEECIQLREEMSFQQQNIEQLQENIMKLEESIKLLNNEAETQNKKILELRNHLRSATQEINYLRETPMSGNDGGGGGSTRKPNTTAPQFDTSVSLFGETPQKNPNMTLKRSTSANSLVSGGASVGGNSNTPGYARSRQRSTSASRFNFQSPERGGGVDELNGSVTDPSFMTRSITTQSPARGTMALQSPVQWLHAFREDVQRAMDDGRCRVITLNECKDIISQIYESKTIANEKALQGVGNVPLETIEQHTYRTLEKKYGLRSLAVGHAGNLLKALDIYSIEDNEVSVFQKIFRNEIEEDFRYVQNELLKSIKELTMVNIMGRNPLKDSQHLQQLLENKINTGYIYEDEWNDMIHYLYNTSDATTIGVLLKRQALLERDDSPAITAMTSSDNIITGTAHLLPGNTVIPHKVTKPNATYVVGTPNVTYHSGDTFQSGQLGYDKTNTRDIKRLGYSSPSLKIAIKDPKEIKINKKDLLKLSFPIFIKIILDYQLRSHCEYLNNFLHLFKQFDADVDGVLNGAEFKQFFHILYINTPRNQLSLSSSQQLDNNGVTQPLLTAEQEEEEELKMLLTLVKLIDPHQHDRFVFSSSVICLQKLQ